MSSLSSFIRKRPPSNIIQSTLQFTLIEFQGMKFLITDSPKRSNIQKYIQELKRFNVATLVIVCEPLYDIRDIQESGVVVLELPHNEGVRPPMRIVAQWLKIAQNHCYMFPNRCLAVHCATGMGRAPVLVALTLIELGLPHEEAIEVIRRDRPRAFNQYQVNFLLQYQPRSLLEVHSNYMRWAHCCIL